MRSYTPLAIKVIGNMLRAIVFVAATLGISYLFRASLKDPKSHGFYRFFAFESILAVIILNVPFWFTNPFSVYQLFAWLFLIVSLFLVVHGFSLLHRVGRPKGRIENTTQLVRVGAYKYIRHPLYSSLLFLTWGSFLKRFSVLGLILSTVATISLLLTAKAEEKENIQRFGMEYKKYMESTKMFIPFVF